jgi:hypothetical protein
LELLALVVLVVVVLALELMVLLIQAEVVEDWVLVLLAVLAVQASLSFHTLVAKSLLAVLLHHLVEIPSIPSQVVEA